MQDATQLAVKAAILESRAIEAQQLADSNAMTALGKTGASHTVAALVWACSVLTAEPVADIRARVQQAAKDRKPLEAYSPRRVA
jgi:hypothetical protein